MPSRRPFRMHLVRLILILLFAALPIIGALTAGGVASALGCRLDEGNVHPCPFLGMDLGETLYAFGELGWLSLLTIPAGAPQLLFWLVAAVALTVKAARSSGGRQSGSAFFFHPRGPSGRTSPRISSGPDEG